MTQTRQRRFRTTEERIRRNLPHLTEELVRDLAGAIERIAAALGAERIYVFGSQARGTPTPDSDVDLLVIVPHADQPAHRLGQTAYGAVGPHLLPVDIIVMPREEFDSRRRVVSSLPATVVREGRVLYAA